jgi:3-oxoacyl-[acyl-carrier-protein] synthase I
MSASVRSRLGPMVVTGFELLTAVGTDATQTCASVRAGLVRLSQLPTFAPTTRDPGWDPEEPLLAACVPDLSLELPLRARLLALAMRVLRRLPARVGLTRGRLSETALLVALPFDDAAVQAEGVSSLFLSELLAASGLPAPGVVRVLAGGHTAAFELLAEAERLLAEERVASVIVLAVDSYLTPPRLAALDEARRVRSERNVDGFIPGEAAAAVFLEPQTVVRRRGGRELAVVRSPGLASEASVVTSDVQSTGRGLGEAIGRALEAAPPGPCPWVLCDLNGESYRAYEWGMAMARLPERLGSVGRLQHPADCLGDIGAASGAMLLGLAARAFSRGYAPAGEALLWTASDGPTRAAVRVEDPIP